MWPSRHFTFWTLFSSSATLKVFILLLWKDCLHSQCLLRLNHIKAQNLLQFRFLWLLLWEGLGSESLNLTSRHISLPAAGLISCPGCHSSRSSIGPGCWKLPSLYSQSFRPKSIVPIPWSLSLYFTTLHIFNFTIPNNAYLLDPAHNDVYCGSPHQASAEVAGWDELELIKTSAPFFQTGLLGTVQYDASSFCTILHTLRKAFISGRQDCVPRLCW